MNGNSPGNLGFDRRTLLTSGVLAGLSVTAVGMAGTAQAVTRRPVRRIARKPLTPDDFMATPQSPWKFCDKCKILYWGPEQTSSVCPAGGTHGGSSSNYTVFFNPTETDQNEQVGWQFCDKCKAMYFFAQNNQASSVCPAGGTHGGPSSTYMMFLGQVAVTGFSSQVNWQFCDKCKGMYYGPERTSSVCPAGGIHGGTTSEYTMLFT
jgi:hypothetical protein